MPTPTHEVYRVLMDANAQALLWTFRIYDTGRVEIEMQRTTTASSIRELAMPPLSIDGFDPRVEFRYIATDCYLTTPSTWTPGTRKCCFSLTHRVDDEEFFPFRFVEYVTCILSPCAGVQWFDDDPDDMAEAIRDVFDGFERANQQPAAWSVTVEPVRGALYPLTCGSYTFKGALLDVDNERVKSPIVIDITLLPGGVVTGTGFESCYHDNAKRVPVSGTWTEDTLELYQDFVVRPPVYRVEKLHMRGDVTKYSCDGLWTSGDRPIDSDDRPTLLFDLSVTSMKRHWSPESHALFPDQFREAVRWCLLSSLRCSTLHDLWMPSAVWTCVFSFCDSSWFM